MTAEEQVLLLRRENQALPDDTSLQQETISSQELIVQQTQQIKGLRQQVRLLTEQMQRLQDLSRVEFLHESPSHAVGGSSQSTPGLMTSQEIAPKNLRVKGLQDSLKALRNFLYHYGWHVLVVLAMAYLLYVGVSWAGPADLTLYECYAVAFWGGLPALKTLPSQQCLFLTTTTPSTFLEQMRAYHLPAHLIDVAASQSPNLPLHALPHEYPLPTMIPFTLAMIAPHDWYQMAFAIWMSLVAVGIYELLRRFRSSWAAIVCALYLVIGGAGTADARFDLIPSALTLVAIISGLHKRWNLAFAFLALATLFKFYPLVLIIPFLLAQQLGSGEKWNSWRRFTPLAVFAALCVMVMSVSLSLSIEGTVGPFSYFEDRPFQVESAAASVLWGLSFLGYPLHFVASYGSLNVLSPFASQLSSIDTVLLGAGLMYVWWLQWRGKADLVVSCLLTLLIVIFTGKVFSPQYLIWIIPLAAYVEERNPKWIVAWCVLGGLTTYIYPYLYLLYWLPLTWNMTHAPLFFSAIAIRNLVLFCIIVSLLLSYSRKQPVCADNKRNIFIGRGYKGQGNKINNVTIQEILKGLQRKGKADRVTA
jgi:hypothetical protein